jgi:hypothetical protein
MKELYIDSRYAQGTPGTTISASATSGSNVLTVSSTVGMIPNQPVTFTGTLPTPISSSTTYYIFSVDSLTTFRISNSSTVGATIISFTSSSGSFTMNFTYQTPNSYTLFLQKPIKNLTLAQVVSLTVNPLSSITSIPNPGLNRGDFIFLDIQELRRPYPIDCKKAVTTGQYPVSTAFGIIQLRELCSTTSGNFYVDKKDNIMMKYTQPIDSIDRLTIRWLDYQGNLLPMGSYNLLTLRLECDEN